MPSDRHVDGYAFRIGDWRADDVEWKARRLGPSVDYVRTRPVPGRYLCDRLNQLKDPAMELRRLKTEYQ